MVEVIYLAPNEVPRKRAEDDGWLPGSERMDYLSEPENDVSLERALSAALDWAERRGVPRIYVHGLASH